MTTAQKLDAILDYVRTHPQKTYIDPTEIIDNVLPGETPESVAVLFELIQKEGAASVNVDNDPPFIWYSATLESFLLHSNFEERLKERRTKKDLLKWQRIVFWPAVIFGIIGGSDALIRWVSSPNPQVFEKEISPSPQLETITPDSLSDTSSVSTEFQSPSSLP